jgi:L-ascorbate metabolism protein UlaG (beta-lactamase superfamily)
MKVKSDLPIPPPEFAVTRVANACVLLDLAGTFVLTDPWFEDHWMFHERPGLAVARLPDLAAIVGSHSVMDHWGISALATRADRASTPVFTATRGMVRRARAAGFALAERLPWGATRTISRDVSLEVVAAQRVMGLRVNNYVFTARGGLRVFFGGETRDLEPLRRYRQEHPPVDVFIGPVNGMRLLGYKLVTSAAEAVEAARILGARTIIPIHDGHRSVGPLAWPESTAWDAVRAAACHRDLRVCCLEPGQRWPAAEAP